MYYFFRAQSLEGNSDTTVVSLPQKQTSRKFADVYCLDAALPLAFAETENKNFAERPEIDRYDRATGLSLLHEATEHKQKRGEH